MATLVNLTYDLADLIGTDYDPRRTRVFVKTNITPDPVIVVDGTTVRLGDVTQKPDADGTGEFTGLIATNSAENPTSFAYRFIVQYNSTLPHMRGEKQTWTSSEFPLTASANIAAIPEAFDGLSVPVAWRSDFRDEMETIRDDVVQISGIDSTDSAVAALVETAAGPLTQAALSATIEAEGIELFGPVVTPEAYGAVGDGSTNDTPAIQSMFDALAAGGVPRFVRFREGADYYLAAEVEVNADYVSVQAHGAKFTGPVAGTPQGGLVTIVDRSDLTRRIRWVSWFGGLFVTQNALDNAVNICAAEHIIVGDVQIDMDTVAGQRGLAIQVNGSWTVGPRYIQVVNLETVGGVNGFNLDTIAGNYASDISLRNARIVGADVGVRCSAGSSSYTLTRIAVDGVDIVDCAQGVHWFQCVDSSLSNVQISGVTTGRGIDAQWSTGRINDVEILGPAATNMGIALTSGTGMRLSNVALHGTFTTALYNGMTDLTVNNLSIKGAAVGLHTIGTTQRAIYDGVTFESVATPINTYRTGDTYRRFYERSGTTTTDLSRYGQTAIEVPVFGYYTQTNFSSLASKGLNSSGAVNAAISWKITPGAGTYTLRLAHTKSTNRGIYTVSVDGVSVGTIDGYDAATADALSELTGIALTNGEHTLTLTMATKHASSSSYFGSFFALALARTA